MQQKIYSYKTYKNPLFKKKPKSRKIKIFISLILLGVLLGSSYFLFISNYFVIKNIKIKNAENTSLENLENQVRRAIKEKSFFKKNIFLINKFNIEQGIMEATNAYQKINIKRILPNTLEIIVKEKNPEIVWISNGKGYYVDANGIILSELDEDLQKETSKDNINILRHKIVLKAMPVVYDLEGKNQPEGGVISEDHIKFIQTIYYDIQKKSQIEVSFFEFSIKDFTLIAKTSAGWKIYFSLLDKAVSQIDKIILIMENKQRIGKIFDYIDLRYDEKVFYK